MNILVVGVERRKQKIVEGFVGRKLYDVVTTGTGTVIDTVPTG